MVNVNYLVAFSFVLLAPPPPQADVGICLNPDNMDNVTLNCTRMSLPGDDTFTYSWTGPSGPINVPESQSLLDVSEQGNYTCVVSNSLGNASTMYEITGNKISFMLLFTVLSI